MSYSKELAEDGRELSHFCHPDLVFTILEGLLDECKKIVNDMHMCFVFDMESVGKLHAEITRFMVCNFDYDASSGVLELGKNNSGTCPLKNYFRDCYNLPSGPNS